MEKPSQGTWCINPASGVLFARQSNLETKTGAPVPAERRPVRF